MNRPFCLITGFLLVTCVAQRTLASDTCTIMYRHQSYNLPNDSPSRTWFAWTATRNDSSRFTTCE